MHGHAPLIASLSEREISSTFSRKTVNTIWQRKWVIPSYVQCYGHRNWSSVERRLPHSRCWSYDSIVGHFGGGSQHDDDETFKAIYYRRRCNDTHTHTNRSTQSFVMWSGERNGHRLSAGSGPVTFTALSHFAFPKNGNGIVCLWPTTVWTLRLNNWANAMEKITKLTHNEHLHFIEFNVKVLVE